MGMDEHAVRSISRLPRDAVVSRILGRFLRRPARGDERRVARHGARAAAAHVQELVSSSLSVRLRHLPLCKGLAVTDSVHVSPGRAAEMSAAQFASDVQYYLTLQPRQLPS